MKLWIKEEVRAPSPFSPFSRLLLMCLSSLSFVVGWLTAAAAGILCAPSFLCVLGCCACLFSLPPSLPLDPLITPSHPFRPLQNPTARHSPTHTQQPNNRRSRRRAGRRAGWCSTGTSTSTTGRSASSPRPPQPTSRPSPRVRSRWLAFALFALRRLLFGVGVCVCT
jgi:hypothetical protein